MCARYFLRIEEHENESIIEELNRRYSAETLPEQPGGLIVPSTLAPVQAPDRHGRAGYFLMRFGLQTGRNLIINARSETAALKPTFRPLLAQRRCLIPASYYIEWEHAGKARIPYRFESAERELLMLAGLYRLDPGERFASFVILTREAAPAFTGIHDRMPLILSREEQQLWLTPGANTEQVLSSGLTGLRFEKEAG